MSETSGTAKDESMSLEEKKKIQTEACLSLACRHSCTHTHIHKVWIVTGVCENVGWGDEGMEQRENTWTEQWGEPDWRAMNRNRTGTKPNRSSDNRIKTWVVWVFLRRRRLLTPMDYCFHSSDMYQSFKTMSWSFPAFFSASGLTIAIISAPRPTSA